jgi:hypothetical protein
MKNARNALLKEDAKAIKYILSTAPIDKSIGAFFYSKIEILAPH